MPTCVPLCTMSTTRLGSATVIRHVLTRTRQLRQKVLSISDASGIYSRGILSFSLISSRTTHGTATSFSLPQLRPGSMGTISLASVTPMHVAHGMHVFAEHYGAWKKEESVPTGPALSTLRRSPRDGTPGCFRCWYAFVPVYTQTWDEGARAAQLHFSVSSACMDVLCMLHPSPTHNGLLERTWHHRLGHPANHHLPGRSARSPLYYEAVATTEKICVPLQIVNCRQISAVLPSTRKRANDGNTEKICRSK